MGSFVGTILRWLIVVVMGIATFYPDYGVAALSFKFFFGAPILVTILDLVWIIALSLVLPLTLKLFRWITTSAVTAISTASVYLLWRDVPAVFNAWPIYMWAVVIAFVGVGWLLVSTPMWRKAQGMLPVQQTDDHHAAPPAHTN